MHNFSQRLAECKPLQAVAKRYTLNNGDTLFHQGDAGGQAYLIEQGYLQLSCVSTSGNIYIAAILNSGELLGVGTSTADRLPHTATAKGSVRVSAYPADAMMRCLSADTRLLQAVLLKQSQHEQILHRRLQAVLNLDVKQRILVALNDLTSQYGQPCQHGHMVDIPLTQEELAQLIGASRPVVNTRLNELRREGVLSYEQGFICINEMSSLRALAMPESD